MVVVGWSFGPAMAAVPFAARALVGTIPEAIMANASVAPVTLKEMIDDFCQQLPEASSKIANVMQSGASTFVLHCTDTRNAEVLLHAGLTFRSHPVKLVAAPNTQWIKLTRVVFGTTENAIKSRLSEYGSVLKIRRELVQGIGISVYSVKMEIQKPIPSRITIAHYPVNVFYRGQVQQCFRCEQTGHISKDCPFKKARTAPTARIVGETEMTIDDPASGILPVLNKDPVVPTVDPPAVPPVLTVDPPVLPSGDTSVSSVLSDEQSSTSTPVNPDTGKRQRPVSGPELPAKKDKQDTPSYDDYEREFLRANALGSEIKDADREVLSSLCQRVPPELYEKYKKTFQYRHPVWKILPTPSPDMLKVLSSLQWPSDCVDLSDSALLDPVVPRGTSPAGIPFSRYDRIRTYVETRKKYPSLPELPVDAQTELDNMPSDARKAFDVFYASTHLESQAGLSQEIRDGLRESMLERCPIDYDDD